MSGIMGLYGQSVDRWRFICDCGVNIGGRVKVEMATRRGEAKRETWQSRIRTSSCFPLVSVDSVVDLFLSQLTGGAVPDLALLSIVLGAVETQLTVGLVDETAAPAALSGLLAPFRRPIGIDEIESLYRQFAGLVRGSADVGRSRASKGKKALRSSEELIQTVLNAIWAGLSSSYFRDRAHMQSIYSFLTGNRLDSFGVALTVVAGCQLLGLDDVRLALTEEHAWIVFGDDGSQSMEITWHGKGVEDKRGQPVTPTVSNKSWLYLGGRCVVCDTYMAVAAMVTSINPSIAADVDSRELNSLQQQLLWILYDTGRLKKYPMAITNIGDLEEVNATPGRPSPEVLFKEAIESAKIYYDNMHVYPYTYLGGYYYRMKHYREALRAWAEASHVISKYNYHRDDEEVYKEFLEIANEIIPNAIRSSAGFSTFYRGGMTGSETSNFLGLPPMLRDPECCALFLKFYDGICEWEEGSSTPVLHITWATHMLNSLSKFDPDARALVQLVDYTDETESSCENFQAEYRINVGRNSDEYVGCTKVDHDFLGEEKLSRQTGQSFEKSSRMISSGGHKHNGKSYIQEADEDNEKNACRLSFWKSFGNKEDGDEDQINATIKKLISGLGSGHSLEPDPTLVALGHACGESILNPAYLRGKGEPFTLRDETGDNFGSVVRSVCYALDDDIPVAATADFETASRSRITDGGRNQMSGNGIDKIQRPVLHLRSMKMKEMKDLLIAKKLNANAIKLHMTAQSQVIVKHSRTGSGVDSNSGEKSAKRRRR